jgi:cysteine-rich repeat protein
MSRAAILIIVLLTVLRAAPAAAQERPSLERIETYLCLAADERGETYRPVFCEPRCPCIRPYAPASCQQLPSGEVYATYPVDPDPICYGECKLNGTPTGTRCVWKGDCEFPTAETCEQATPNYCVTAQVCNADWECDQSKGYVCLAGLSSSYSFCAKLDSDCTQIGATCDTGVGATVALFGFSPLGDPTPLTCPAGGGDINSTDAAECIGQIEAGLGAGACGVCGDGNLGAGEQCDDGNLDPGDGCAADCTTE